MMIARISQKQSAGSGNSEGGVIVWGVDCRQTAQGDVPNAAMPITDARAFKTLLDGSIGGLTLPAHAGVENLDLRDGTGSGGFVVTRVSRGTEYPIQDAISAARILYPRRIELSAHSTWCSCWPFW